MDGYISTGKRLVEGIFLCLVRFRLRVKEAVAVGVRENEQAAPDL